MGRGFYGTAAAAALFFALGNSPAFAANPNFYPDWFKCLQDQTDELGPVSDSSPTEIAMTVLVLCETEEHAVYAGAPKTFENDAERLQDRLQAAQYIAAEVVYSRAFRKPLPGWRDDTKQLSLQ